MNDADDFYKRELAKFERAWADGKNWPALFAAVRWCGAAEIPLPEWAGLAVLNLVRERFHRPPGNRGGTSRHARKYAEDLEHWRRWSAVTLLKRQGVPWSRVYSTAATNLYGAENVKGGGADAVEASYKIVSKAKRTGSGAFLFTFVDPGDLG